MNRRYNVNNAIDKNNKRNGHQPLYCYTRGKIRHASRSTAKAHLKHLQNVEKDKTGRLVVYKCPVCHDWHVGHKKEVLL